MTLFAVSDRRPVPDPASRPAASYFYWLAPYPNTMPLWPQWRSALVWDFWAILSYLLFSILFWYVGLIPDLATMRDRAHGGRRSVSTVCSRSAGAARPGIGDATTSSTDDGGARPCRWSSRCKRSSASTSRRA